MSEYTQGVCHDGAAILKDGIPLTIEQILEGLRESDALAAHVERQSELLRRLVEAMRNYEMDAEPDYPPPRDHRAMMSDAEAALEAVPKFSPPPRLKMKWQAEAFEFALDLTEDPQAKSVLRRLALCKRKEQEAHQ